MEASSGMRIPGRARISGIIARQRRIRSRATVDMGRDSTSARPAPEPAACAALCGAAGGAAGRPRPRDHPRARAAEQVPDPPVHGAGVGLTQHVEPSPDRRTEQRQAEHPVGHALGAVEEPKPPPQDPAPRPLHVRLADAARPGLREGADEAPPVGLGVVHLGAQHGVGEVHLALVVRAEGVVHPPFGIEGRLDLPAVPEERVERERGEDLALDRAAGLPRSDGP